MKETEPSESSLVQEFAANFAARQALASQLASAPETLQDLLTQGLTRADQRLEELATNEEVSNYYRQLGEQPVRLLEELEKARPMLESLGLSEQVDSKRREIEGLWNSSPEMQAARYFMDRGLLETAGVELEIEPEPQQPVGEGPSAKQPESGEMPKQAITIAIDPQNNILINQKPYSLGREATLASAGSETMSRQFRADTLRLLAANPDRKFTPGELWAELCPDKPMDHGVFSTHIREFFYSPPTYRNRPIITVEKVKPRLNVYGLGEFNVTVVDTDKLVNIETPIYILPNGLEVAGKTGRVIQRMLRASRKKPVTREDILDLYDEGEAYDPRTVLSGLASVVRARLDGTGLTLHKVSLDERDPQTHRAYVGYYISQAKHAVEDGGIRASEPPAKVETEELACDKLLGLHEATVLSAFLVAQKERLVEHGLRPLEEAVFDQLNQRVVETYTNGQPSDRQLQQLRKEAFEKALRLINDRELLAAFENSLKDKADPRLDLLLELLDYSDDDGVSYLQELLASHPEMHITFDVQKRAGYVISDIQRTRIGEDGKQL